jgi:hypothetical protein
MAQHRPSTAQPNSRVGLYGALAALGVLLALLASAVALGIAGWATESIIGLLAAVGGVAATMIPLVLAAISRLEQVEHNTNGRLTQTVTNAVNNAVPPAVQEAVHNEQSTTDGRNGTLAA